MRVVWASPAIYLLTDTSRRGRHARRLGLIQLNRPLTGTPRSVHVRVQRRCERRPPRGGTSAAPDPGYITLRDFVPTVRGTVSDREGARRHPSEAEHAGTLLADITRKKRGVRNA